MSVILYLSRANQDHNTAASGNASARTLNSIRFRKEVGENAGDESKGFDSRASEEVHHLAVNQLVVNSRAEDYRAANHRAVAEGRQ